MANTIHLLLDQLPGDRFPILSCGGELEGYRMRIDWSKHRSFVYGTWEPHVVEALVQAVEPGTVAVDIGAHIGFYTLLLSKRVGQSGLVVAFEPLPPNFRVLRENLQLNFCPHVRAVNKAVTDRPGRLEATIPREEALPGSVSLFADYGGEPVVIDTVTLDEFVRGLTTPVHFIKIDVEGAEDVVLAGAIETIKSCHPKMIIELHHFNFPREQHPVLPMLREFGYKLRWLNQWDLTSHVMAT